MMRSKAGLTLIEVMGAILIMSVGVLMAAAMQTSGLQASSKAIAVQNVTKRAEAEMNFQRALVDPLPTCQTLNDSAYTCTITFTPCFLVNTATQLQCVDPPTAQVVANLIRVTVADKRGNAITLRTIKTGA